MKKITLVVLLMTAINIYGKASDLSIDAAKYNFTLNASADSVLVLNVTEMACKTDSKMVQTALYRKGGVKKVAIDGETVAVTYNPSKISRSQIIEIIENTGTCEDPNAKVHKVKVKS